MIPEFPVPAAALAPELPVPGEDDVVPEVFPPDTPGPTVITLEEPEEELLPDVLFPEELLPDADAPVRIFPSIKVPVSID